MPSSAELLQQLYQSTNNISGNVGIMPDDADTSKEKKDYIEDARDQNSSTDQAVGLFGEFLNVQQEQLQEADRIMNSSRKVFSLIRQAQSLVGDPSMDDYSTVNDSSPLPHETGIESTGLEKIFSDVADLKDFIDQQLDGEDVDIKGTIDNIIQHFTSLVSEDSQQRVNDSLKRYLQFRGQTGITPNEELQMLQPVFEALPKTMKTPEYGRGDNTVPATKRVANIVQKTNNEIRKMAEVYARSIRASRKSFNLSKHAQHKGFENSIMYGPSGTRIDPFTGMQINDWHVIERNKGFGLKIDDIHNIDWENVWRSTIMDKYSRPYKNNDGEWVGGYIEKRFETDKWIPEGNNYQLKPGQLRHPRSPEYGLTEARMEAMRAKGDRGYGPESSGNPTDWNENGYANIRKGKESYAKKSSNGFNLKTAKIIKKK